jgi:hypothetical protein
MTFQACLLIVRPDAAFGGVFEKLPQGPISCPDEKRKRVQTFHSTFFRAAAFLQ